MDENAIKSEIEKGIAQVDDTLFIDEFTCSLDKEKRILNVRFTAKSSSSGETIAIETTY